MTDETKKRLHDVLEACRAIERFTAGRDFAGYRQDDQLRAAVERKFEIIGEAFSKLAESDPDAAQGFADLPRIVGLRNGLIHGYDSVDDGIVWDIVKNKLPKLQSEVERRMHLS